MTEVPEMPELQTFKIRVRQYADGSTWAASDHDLTHYVGGIDDLVAGVDDGTPYREFDVEITSRPPVRPETTVAVHVTVPDEPEPAAEPVSATAAA